MKITVCKGCGQKMQAIDQDGKPACTTCIGLHKDSGIPIEIEVDIENAKCCYCKKIATKSSFDLDNLPFYDSTTNTYYCGCRGWE